MNANFIKVECPECKSSEGNINNPYNLCGECVITFKEKYDKQVEQEAAVAPKPQKKKSREAFIPKLHEDGHVEMLVMTHKCPTCKNPTMKGLESHSIFNVRNGLNQKDQMMAAGIRMESKVDVNGIKICQQCEKEGKATIHCQLCDKDQPADMVEESTGWPYVYLCKDCYATVPAKVWDKKLSDLQHEHRYDLD